MGVNYKNGAIVYEGKFYERINYNVSNNVLLCGFDGMGGLSAYSVVNKWEFLQGFSNIFETQSGVIDFAAPKTVEMAGRRQIIRFGNGDADITVTQFADDLENAVFFEFTAKAKKDTFFKTVINYEVEFNSYISNLFTSRFSLKNIRKLLLGSLKSTIKGRKTNETKDDCLIIRSDPWGECYIDFAISAPAETLDSNVVYTSQFKSRLELKEGEEKTVRLVAGMGTCGDFSHTDVYECFLNFDKHKKSAERYIAEIPYPESADSEFLRAFYSSLYNCSLSMYKEVGDFKGFLAGLVYQSPARTYFRDSYWTMLPLYKHNPQLVRNEILTLARGIGKDGVCPSAVKYNFKNWWGNHYDSPSFFAIMLYDYVRHTGDRSVLSEKWRKKTILSAAVMTVEKLAENCDATGLLYKGGKFNRRDWCDNVMRVGYVTYDEALFARALYSLAELTKDTDSELSSKYYERYEKVKKAINDILWDSELGYFVNYKNENEVEDNLSIDTVPMILFGLTDDERALGVLKNMEKLLESKNNENQKAGDFGVLSVYPFYKYPEAVVAKSSYPYYYHNGADWPYWSAAYAYAKLMHGMDYEYPLTRWFSYNADKKNFTPVEFFSPFHKQGSLLQAWSGAGAFLLQHTDGRFFKK